MSNMGYFFFWIITWATWRGRNKLVKLHKKKTQEKERNNWLSCTKTNLCSYLLASETSFHWHVASMYGITFFWGDWNILWKLWYLNLRSLMQLSICNSEYTLYWCTWYFVWDSENSWKHCHDHFPSEGFLKLSITNVFVALYYCVTTQKLDMNILCSFIYVVPKLKFTSKEWFFSLQWQHSHLVTRIHEGSEKSAVAGYCLHHPSHQHRREPPYNW